MALGGFKLVITFDSISSPGSSPLAERAKGNDVAAIR